MIVRRPLELERKVERISGPLDEFNDETDGDPDSTHGDDDVEDSDEDDEAENDTWKPMPYSHKVTLRPIDLGLIQARRMRIEATMVYRRQRLDALIKERRDLHIAERVFREMAGSKAEKDPRGPK